MNERRARENGYLNNVHIKSNDPAFPNPKSIAELQTQVMALAGEMAALTATGGEISVAAEVVISDTTQG
jgi:hypothetical protein